MAGQLMNQFFQTAQQGMLDLKNGPGTTVSCQLDATSAGGLVAGVPVKIVDNGGYGLDGNSLMHVVEAAATTDDIFGFIVYDMKSTSYAVGDKLEVAFFRGACMYMTANAAWTRWAKLEAVIASPVTNQWYVQTQTGSDRVIGRAFDKAVAQGNLARVIIDLPGQTS